MASQPPDPIHPEQLPVDPPIPSPEDPPIDIPSDPIFDPGIAPGE